MFRTYEPARDRLAAVKAFRLDMTPEQARALADELQRVADAELEHHAIVSPLGAGVEGTLAYAATEYVAAESLDVALKHYAPAPLDKVLPFITQLAGAIDFARAAGIGLGALHPRDVFVTPDDARVTGFGVVQALEHLGIRAPVRRPYTAPERVVGGEWDVRADVYSLGAIAFELLTARRPVGPEVGDLGSTAGPHAAAVAQVISRALADDPADRYPSALAFAAALEASSHGEAASDAIPERSGIAAAEGGMLAPVHEIPGESRTLVFEPDIDVEREADEAEAEIQLREHEVSARQLEEVEPVLLPELPREPQPDPELQPEAVHDFGLLDAPHEPDATPERTAEPALFNLDSAPRTGVEPASEVPPADYAREPQIPEPAPAAPYVAPPARREPPLASRAPRPVFLPVAITLLLGLFVGFLAGYLVGSRESTSGLRTDTSGANPPGSPSEPETSASQEQPRSTANPPGSPGRPARSAAQGSSGRPSPSGTPAGGGRSAPPVSSRTEGTPSPSPGGSGRSAPQVSPAPQTRPVSLRGRLMVRSTPAGAQVFVNGRRRGTTPLALRDLAPGTYTLRVARAGFDEQSRRVTVNSSGVRDVNLRLEPTRPATPASFAGALYVDSRPRGARVFLDGKEIGTTPMQTSDIRAGAHVVRLELRDHRTWTASARVVAGEVTRVTGSLERQQ